MNGHNLIVMGLVLVAITAHALVWWSSKRIWDGVVIGAVLCLAGMAMDTQRPTTTTTMQSPIQDSLVLILERLDATYKERSNANISRAD